MSQDLYNMQLNEVIYMDYVNIRRVPGGWIYEYKHMDAAVFVPFHNEFQEESIQ